MRSSILSGVVAFVLIATTAALGASISIGPNYGEFETSGSIQSNGTIVNLVTDLNLGEDKPGGVTLEMSSGMHRIRLDYSKYEFSGESTLTKTFTFEGQNYTVGALVESDLSYELTEFTYYYDAFAQGGLMISPLFKLNIYNVEMNIDAPGLGLSESYSETLPVPMAGMMAAFPLGNKTVLIAQACGIGYSDGSLMEYKTAVMISPVPMMSVEIGYKETQVDFSDGTEKLNFETTGYYAVVSIGMQF